MNAFRRFITGIQLVSIFFVRVKVVFINLPHTYTYVQQNVGFNDFNVLFVD